MLMRRVKKVELGGVARRDGQGEEEGVEEGNVRLFKMMMRYIQLVTTLSGDI